jgi:hypothetical protein
VITKNTGTHVHSAFSTRILGEVATSLGEIMQREGQTDGMDACSVLSNYGIKDEEDKPPRLYPDMYVACRDKAVHRYISTAW